MAAGRVVIQMLSMMWAVGETALQCTQTLQSARLGDHGCSGEAGVGRCGDVLGLSSL